MRKFSKQEISFETSAENARTKKGFLRRNIISWSLYTHCIIHLPAAERKQHGVPLRICVVFAL